jgi:hypothetical protein
MDNKMKIDAELANILFAELSQGDEYEGFKVVHDGDWIDEGKYQNREVIVEKDGKCYALCDSRSGSYYTDWYYCSEDDWKNGVEMPEVIKKEKIIYEWVKA